MRCRSLIKLSNYMLRVRTITSTLVPSAVFVVKKKKCYSYAQYTWVPVGWLVALTPLRGHTYRTRRANGSEPSDIRIVEPFAYEMAYAACVATAHLNGQGLAVQPRTYFCDLLLDGARSP